MCTVFEHFFHYKLVFTSLILENGIFYWIIKILFLKVSWVMSNSHACHFILSKFSSNLVGRWTKNKKCQILNLWVSLSCDTPRISWRNQYPNHIFLTPPLNALIRNCLFIRSVSLLFIFSKLQQNRPKGRIWNIPAKIKSFSLYISLLYSECLFCNICFIKTIFFFNFLVC